MHECCFFVWLLSKRIFFYKIINKPTNKGFKKAKFHVSNFEVKSYPHFMNDASEEVSPTQYSRLCLVMNWQSKDGQGWWWNITEVPRTIRSSSVKVVSRFLRPNLCNFLPLVKVWVGGQLLSVCFQLAL